MKQPKPFIPAKSPLPVPMSGTVKRMLDQWSPFAHHPPFNPAEDRHVSPPRMKRPRGGHGPHNPME